MQKVVIWDWTGPVVDESGFDKAVCETMEIESAKKRGLMPEEIHEEFQRLLRKREGTWKWHDYVFYARGLGVDWREIHLKNLDKLKVIPDAENVLEYCRGKGYFNCLATNGKKEIIEFRAKQKSLIDYFDLIVGSDTVRAMKSEGKHFEYGLKKLKVEPENAWSIDDNYIQGIESAKRYDPRIKTVLCLWKDTTYFHSPHISANFYEKIDNTKVDYTITNLLQIKNVIK